MWIIVAIGVILIFLVLANYISATEKEAERKIHEKSMLKEFDRGYNAKRLSTAKDALEIAEREYSSLSGKRGNKDAFYREELREVRKNIDELVHKQWEKKASAILDKFLTTYALIIDASFDDVERAHRSKVTCLRQYDAYWEWTRQVHEDNRDSILNLNVWDEAKKEFYEAFKSRIGSPDIQMISWSSGHTSTRQRIDGRLTDAIRAMQPVYQHKTSLRSLILRRIRNAKTVQRSKLLNGSYAGFVKAEVNACYKGLLKERYIIETKQGDLWFVTLTEKGERACPAKVVSTNKPVKKVQKPRKENATVPVEPVQVDPSPDMTKEDHPLEKTDATTITTIDQLLTHLDLHQIKWVDKRSAGGCLWVISTTETDALLADLQIDGKRFKKANTRHFVASDGWFMQK